MLAKSQVFLDCVSSFYMIDSLRSDLNFFRYFTFNS